MFAKHKPLYSLLHLALLLNFLTFASALLDTVPGLYIRTPVSISDRFHMGVLHDPGAGGYVTTTNGYNHTVVWRYNLTVYSVGLSLS